MSIFVQTSFSWRSIRHGRRWRLHFYGKVRKWAKKYMQVFWGHFFPWQWTCQTWKSKASGGILTSMEVIRVCPAFNNPMRQMRGCSEKMDICHCHVRGYSLPGPIICHFSLFGSWGWWENIIYAQLDHPYLLKKNNSSSFHLTLYSNKKFIHVQKFFFQNLFANTLFVCIEYI